MTDNPFAKRILVVEDDRHIAEALKLNLELQGYEVNVAETGISGLRKWKDVAPDLVVLDIMLPGIDGLSILRNIRLEDERVPILILSARSASEDRVKGLMYGVDDYLTKPFELDEFLLRVKRLLKRATWAKGREHGEPDTSMTREYRFGENRINFETQTAYCGGKTIRLTEQETKLLRLFVANKGRPLSRKELLEIGWGYSGNTSTRTLDNFIVRLRKYFEEDPQNPVFFRSRRSVGYIFDHD